MASFWTLFVALVAGLIGFTFARLGPGGFQQAPVQSVAEKVPVTLATFQPPVKQQEAASVAVASGHQCDVTALLYPVTTVLIAFNSEWLRASDKPVKYSQFIYSKHQDVFISGSMIDAKGNGDQMFEAHIREEAYSWLRPTAAITKSTGRRAPVDPLIIDAGANIGLHAVLFAALGFRVHAFEPLKRNFNLLKCSAAANKFENLHLNHFGLGTEVSESCMEIYEGNQGGANILPKEKQANCPEESKIRTRTLDEYWKTTLKKERAFLMKMDIQGFEPIAIAGGKEMFTEAPPMVIQMEFSPHAMQIQNIDPEQVLKDLVAYGYGFRVAIGGGETFKTSAEDIAKLTNQTISETIEDDLLLVHLATLKEFEAGNGPFKLEPPYEPSKQDLEKESKAAEEFKKVLEASGAKEGGESHTEVNEDGEVVEVVEVVVDANGNPIRKRLRRR